LYDIFYASWIAKTLLAMSLLSIIYPYLKLVYRRMDKSRGHTISPT
jgi:hypothetical protein